MNIITRTPDQSINDRISAHLVNRPKVGSKFPDLSLTRYNKREVRENFTTLKELKGLVVIFTVPGAWTPTCTGEHLAGFRRSAQKIFALGVDKLICIAPDKVDVAHNWNKERGDPLIEMWADDRGELTDALGFGLNMSGDRAQGMGMLRTAAILYNGVYRWLEIEPMAASCVKSHADNVLKALKEVKSKL